MGDGEITAPPGPTPEMLARALAIFDASGYLERPVTPSDSLLIADLLRVCFEEKSEQQKP